ncbi:hypothetical protein GQ44DRAFT_705339 [Phaeosphaeriaceae sp. PMI808]|nr:hypothetical protein GQ44DRAFT_705339 [Phaeosphaeriaceae sp. PMI808]
MSTKFNYLSEWEGITRTCPLVKCDEWLWDGNTLREQNIPWEDIASIFKKGFNDKTQFSLDWIHQRLENQKEITVAGKHSNGCFALIMADVTRDGQSVKVGLHIGWISKQSAEELDTQMASRREFHAHIYPWTKYFSGPFSSMLIWLGYGKDKELAPFQVQQNAS